MPRLPLLAICLCPLIVSCSPAETPPTATAPTTAVAPATMAAAISPEKLPFTISPETTRITSPLRPDGSPAYIAAMNEASGKGVTPENNGFVLWLQILDDGRNFISPIISEQTRTLVGAKPRPTGAPVWQAYVEFLQSKKINPDETGEWEKFEDLPRELWTPAGNPLAAEYLQTQEKLLDLAREAAARPRFWWPCLPSDGPMISVIYPSMGGYREVGTALCIRAILRAQSGDFDNFAADILAAKRLARQVGSNNLAIGILVGVSIDRIADTAAGTVVGSGKLTAEQCDKFSKMLDALRAIPSIADSADTWGRYTLLDCILLVPRHDPLVQQFQDFDDSFKDIKTIDPDAVDWDAALQYANRSMDALVRTLKAPTLQALREGEAAMEKRHEAWGIVVENNGKDGLAPHNGEAREAYTARVTQTIMAELFTNMARAEELWRVALMEDDALRVLLAAARVKGSTGNWPVALKALVPASLKELPVDLYSPDGESALHYRVADGTAIVYSVGRNGQDDAGKGDDISVGFNPPVKLPGTNLP